MALLQNMKAYMQIQRCTHTMIELDAEPRFAFASLLSGGNGMDSTPRWMAYAAHLEAPIQVDLAELQVLQNMPSATPHAYTELAEQHGNAVIDSLLIKGLLLSDEEKHANLRERDQVLRDVAALPGALLGPVDFLHGFHCRISSD